MIAILLLVILLILVNALYVAAEFAAVSVRHTQIKTLAEEGNNLAKRLLPILDNQESLDRYVACCQVGITLSSLMLGAVGQVTFSALLGELIHTWFALPSIQAYSIAAIVVLILLTAAQVIFGELMPKSLALQFPVKMALFTFLPMNWSIRIFNRFISFLNGSGNILLKLLKIQSTSHGHVHSPQEIAMIIAESREGGLLKDDEFKRLHQALSLSAKTAHQIMIPRGDVKAVDINLPVSEIVSNLVASPYSRLPVYQDTIDKVIGIVRVKDLVSKYAHSQDFQSLKEILLPVTLVPEFITAERVLTLLRERGAHQALVVDEHGSLKGLITIEDVIAELFGEISDEFKVRAKVQFEELSPTTFRVAGKIRLDHLTAKIGISFDGEADTLNGFILDRLGGVPLGKEVIQIDSWQITVEKVRNRVVKSAILTKVLEAGDS